MKFKILIRIFFVIILFLSVLNLYSQDNNFNIEQMFTDFNGVCHNDKVVIAYGNHGIILLSTDKGQNWSQKKIVNDSLNIKKIINIQNSFFGICDKGFLIKSDENATKWQIKNNGNQFVFFGLTTDENNLYVLTLQKTVEIFNLNFDKIKSIKIDTTFAPLMICYFKNKLLLPNNKEANILSIDINDNYKQTIIDVGEYGSWVKDLKINNGKLYADIENSLFSTNLPTQKWDKVSYKINNYIVNNGQIYNLKVSTHIKWNVSWIDFYKIDENLKREKINIDSIDRYVVNPIINDYEFIDDNTIIAVGYGKTIFISTNKGQIWQLKSNVNYAIIRSFYNKWLNRKLGFFANGGQIFKTENGGITWIPQKFTDTLIKKIKYLDAFYIDSTGKGFAFSTDNSEIWEDSTKNRNFIYTLDFGETYNGSFQSRVVRLTTRTGINIVKTDSNYLIYTALTTNPMTYFLKFNNNFNLVDRFLLDSIYITDMRYSNGKLRAVAMNGRGKYSSFFKEDSSMFLLLNSSDQGKSWIEVSNFKLHGIYPIPFIWNNEGIFLTTQIKNSNNNSYFKGFYFLNYDNNKLIKLFVDTTYFSRFLMYYQKKIFIINHNNKCFSSADYFNDNPKFNIEIVSPLLKKSVIYWTNDTLIYASYSIKKDNKYYINLIKLIPLNETSINQQIEKSQYFFSTSPFPMPARDIVSFDFYWDQGVNISKAKIKIFNFFGNEIKTNNDIITIPIKSYSEKVIWNCSNVPSGIYFINISYCNFSKSVPIIVVK